MQTYGEITVKAGGAALVGMALALVPTFLNWYFLGLVWLSVLLLLTWYVVSREKKWWQRAGLVFIILIMFLVTAGRLYETRPIYPSFIGESQAEGKVKYVAFDGVNLITAKVNLNTPYRGEVTLRTNELNLRVGEVIKFEGKFKISESGRVSINYPEIKSRQAGNFLFKYLSGVRIAMVGRIYNFLGGDRAGLLTGLLVGERSGFSFDFSQAMKRSGTTHLVALSGYNITILAYILGLMLAPFMSSKYKLIVATIIIGLFVLLVGAEASIVRAAIMGILALLAVELKRSYAILNAMIVAAAGMALFDPRVLGEIGFQLSFLALIGIVYLMPIIKRWLKMKEGGSLLSWRESLLTTVSAQIAVLPLLLYYFNYFSLLSVLTNIMILWAVPYTMLLGFVLLLISGVSGFGAAILAKPVNLILGYQVGVINYSARFEILSIDWSISLWLVIIYYTGFFILIYRQQTGRKYA